MKKLNVIIAFVLAAIIMNAAPVFAKTYANPRFAFAVDLPETWFKYKNPPPVNNDGASFTMPDGAYLSVSGSHNALNQNLEQAAQMATGEAKLIKKTKIKYGEMKGVKVISKEKNMKKMIYVFIRNISDGSQVVYTIYYTAPQKAFEKYRRQVEKAARTFRFTRYAD